MRLSGFSTTIYAEGMHLEVGEHSKRVRVSKGQALSRATVSSGQTPVRQSVDPNYQT